MKIKTSFQINSHELVTRQGIITSTSVQLPCWMGSLSPQHGASSGCGWRNGLQLWRVAANILNKQPRKHDNGWFYSLGVGHGANNL
jgi:hypothetical protein